MTQSDPTREAQRWHEALNGDPRLPDCSGTHLIGYGFCQLLAVIAAALSTPPAPSLDVEERRDAFAAIRLALKGARGMALDSDATALDAELGKAIDLLDWLSTEPSE